ncbi:ATP-dependent DNA helicase Q1-like [Octopus vulgaris]|uniref:ATP-dependent DNA helicase n=1 Tax=Octopus vulgaris TaxID=6645 RepID=A0AA36AZQ2_OCTVU|nr:ATP-dependent DNA helicase Q1-like [Octopus vulgaris]
MDTYRKELADVKQQLVETEQLLQDVLKRQSALLQKKEELETILRESSSKPKKDDKDWSLTDFKWSLKLKEKMKSVFHIDKLRPLQMETMNVTMVGEDCLLIMPTGGGKSLCFQLPAIISNGITLVVSPLISLVEDQLVALESLKIEAKTLNSSTERTEATRIMNAMLDKNDPLKILYVTPEKLAKSKRFMAKLEKMYQLGRFSRLVIDEVHCCSQWGHDFRPDYKFLGIMKRQFPEVPILGLTATATVKVLNDVKKILCLNECILFRASFNRPNLFYEIRSKSSNAKEVLKEISEDILKKFRGLSGRDDKVAHCIIYYRLNDVMRQSTMVFTEQTGIENLYALMEYCSDVSRCRRSMIARHFGETWSSSDCNRMCDNCKAASTSTIKTKNVNKYAADVLTLVKRGRQIEQFHTLTKLVDAWFGKGAPTLRVREIKAPTLTRQTCERIIAMMLLKGYLKEDFHFTPYSTISYIMSGPKSSFITANHEVSLDFQVPSHAKDKSVLSETSSKSEVKSSNKRTSLPVHDVDSENSPPRKISKRPIIIDDDEEEEEESTKNSDSNDFIPQKPTKHE